MPVLRDGGMEITPGTLPRTGPKHSKAEQDTAKHSKTKHPGQSPQQAPSTAMQSKTQQSKAKSITQGNPPSRPQAQPSNAKQRNASPRGIPWAGPKQSKARLSKAKLAKQSKAKQSKAKQSKAQQS